MELISRLGSLMTCFVILINVDFSSASNSSFFFVNYFSLDYCILYSSSHKCSAVLGLGFIQ